jgi:hypothetical protein
MRDRLTTGEVPFRKAYLGALIDRVKVDDTQVRIFGQKDVLEQAVIANGGPFPWYAPLFADGGPGRTRTCNLRNRNPALYPIELRVRNALGH